MTVLTDTQKKKEENKQLAKEKNMEDRGNSSDNDEERPNTPPKRVIEQTEYVKSNHKTGKGTEES